MSRTHVARRLRHLYLVAFVILFAGLGGLGITPAFAAPPETTISSAVDGDSGSNFIDEDGSGNETVIVNFTINPGSRAYVKLDSTPYKRDDEPSASFYPSVGTHTVLVRGRNATTGEYDRTPSSVTFKLCAAGETTGCGVSSISNPGVTPPPPAACADGIDNDNDGQIDYPNDLGCTSSSDTDETNPPPPPPAACADGLDNDSDLLIDYPNDPGCTSTTDTDETNAPPPPTDTDGDGVPDSSDACPTVFGLGADGCPVQSGDFGPWKWNAAAGTVDTTWPTTAISSNVPNPNFANGDYGIATAYAKDGDPTYSFGTNEGTVTFRIPLGSRPTNGSDHHLTVFDGTKALDLYDAVYNSTTQRISSAAAGRIYTWPGAVNLPTGWCGNAACTPNAAGLIKPEDLRDAIAENRALPYTLQFSQPNIRGPSSAFRYPATHNVPTGNQSATVEGTWVRIKPSFNCGTVTVAYQRVICLTFQKHGGINRDNGGAFGVYAENLQNTPSRSWSIAGVSGSYPSLTGVPWASQLEVLRPPSP